MRRIAVVGNSGSGKSTLAGQLADKVGPRPHRTRLALTAMSDRTWDHAEVHQFTSIEAVSKFLAEAA